MATYLETYDGSPFTDWERDFAARTAQDLGLKPIDDRNFRNGRGEYVGIRDDTIQAQLDPTNPEGVILLALAAHATRFTTDQLVGRGDNKRKPLTELLPIYRLN
ncbi:MAG: hypothetical protein ABH864_00085 [archaeon]